MNIILKNLHSNDRLGHALYLTNEQKEMLLNKNRRTCIEICPTSNVQTLELSSLIEHPTLSTWLSNQHKEYPICICTDDRGVFRTSLSKEYYSVAKAYQLTRADVVRLARMAIHYVFDKNMKSQVERYATTILQNVLFNNNEEMEEMEEKEEKKNNLLKRNQTISLNSNNNKITVVGITGVSCAGKSTITNKLLEKYPSIKMINLDTFRAYTLFGYRHTNSDGLRDWDHPSNAAWNAIQVEIKKQISSLPPGSILILDGHMLLRDERIRNVLDICVYINLNKNICYNRRLQRNMPSPSGWNHQEYFNQCIWKSHLNQHAIAERYFKTASMLLTLSGNDNMDSLIHQIELAISSSNLKSSKL